MNCFSHKFNGNNTASPPKPTKYYQMGMSYFWNYQGKPNYSNRPVSPNTKFHQTQETTRRCFIFVYSVPKGFLLIKSSHTIITGHIYIPEVENKFLFQYKKEFT